MNHGGGGVRAQATRCVREESTLQLIGLYVVVAKHERGVAHECQPACGVRSVEGVHEDLAALLGRSGAELFEFIRREVDIDIKPELRWVERFDGPSTSVITKGDRWANGGGKASRRGARYG